ncbi:MAG: condensation domain-containing protein, partial [Bacteroidota bacterium]
MITIDVHTLLNQLEGLGCRLYLDGEHLKLDAPRGVVTPEIQEEIKAMKPELMQYLAEHAGDHSFIPEVRSMETYPVSLGQRRLWILSQFENASVTYNVPITIALNGSYHIENFRKAIHAVIERHEVLRTVFVLDENNEPRQKVLPLADLGFELIYKDYCDIEEGEAKAHQENYEDSLIPFDLQHGPVLRAVLTQVAEEQFVFYYNMHHMISDGWSMDVLAKDLFAYYQYYQNDLPHGLEPLRIQYKDYAAWQLGQMDRPEFRAHRDYWMNVLYGDLPLLELPSQQLRPKVKTYNGRSLGAFLSPQVTEGLHALSRSYGGSLYMTLVAVWKVLCYKYTAQRDIIIGSPIAGREHPDLENQIGFYVNTLVLRNEIHPKDTFCAFCKQVAARTLEAYSHQEYPFDRLVEDLDMERDMSRTPIYDVAITMQERRDNGQTNAHDTLANGAIYDYGEAFSKFDVHLTFEERAGGVHFNVVYNTDIYDTTLIEQLMMHYQAIADVVIESPKVAIKDIDYLTRKEKTSLISSFNSSGVCYPSAATIVSIFEEQVSKYPEQVAVCYDNTELTYLELHRKSNQLAHYLMSCGLEKETFVPLCLDRSVDMIIAILAVLKAGGAYVPVTPETPRDRLAFIAEDTRAGLVVGHSTHEPLFPGLKFVAMDRFEYTDYSEDTPDVKLAPDQLAYVIYTSGTTGKPKGVLIPHSNVVRLLFNEADLFDFTSDDVWCMFHSYSFDFSVW